MSARAGGYTLAELLTALPLALLLGALVLGGVIAQTRLARQLGERVARAEAERIAATLLGAELRWTVPADVRGEGGDSVRSRVLRGVGIPCGTAGELLWTGMRSPAAEKDSALVIDASGEHAVAVTGVLGAASCAGHAVELGGSAVVEGVVLVFETGTYYLSQRALRYRTGAEGRQPLTDEWFLDPPTALLRGPQGERLGVQLVLRPLRGGADGLELRRLGWALPNLVREPQ